MKLLWIKYGSPAKHDLFLQLSDSGGTLILLKSKLMDKAELRLVRQSFHMLSRLDLDSRMRWLKDRAPQSMKNAYRKFRTQNITILKEYLPG